jgi:small conductance mechanosensitive channel
MSELRPLLLGLAPTFATVAAGVACLIVANRLLLRRSNAGGRAKLPRQLVMLALTGAFGVAVVLALPVTESTRNQLLTLLGLVLTGIIAFSSTTFVSNAMAGVMLGSIRSFRPGDFVRVGEHFGRVTERGLFHTELQTEDRDLTTLPNLYLVSNPVTVIRSSGTIVSATLSLGYEISHTRVERLLLEAAARTELEEPFVQVIDLGNDAVGYRIAGFQRDVKRVLTARSNLRRHVLDALHSAGVEIVSPQFMNQRVLDPEFRAIPTAEARPRERADERSPEEIVFDKAEAAERVEHLVEEREELAAELKELEQRAARAAESERPPLERRVARRKARLAEIERALERKEESSP